MFRGHCEQQLDVVRFDLSTQRPAKCTAAPRPLDAGGLGQLALPLPTEPGAPARGFAGDYQLAAGTYDYPHQCTGNLPRPAPDTGTYRRRRLPHSFL